MPTIRRNPQPHDWRMRDLEDQWINLYLEAQRLSRAGDVPGSMALRDRANELYTEAQNLRRQFGARAPIVGGGRGGLRKELLTRELADTTYKLSDSLASSFRPQTEQPQNYREYQRLEWDKDRAWKHLYNLYERDRRRQLGEQGREPFSSRVDVESNPYHVRMRRRRNPGMGNMPVIVWVLAGLIGFAWVRQIQQANV